MKLDFRSFKRALAAVVALVALLFVSMDSVFAHGARARVFVPVQAPRVFAPAVAYDPCLTAGAAIYSAPLAPINYYQAGQVFVPRQRFFVPANNFYNVPQRGFLPVGGLDIRAPGFSFRSFRF